MEIVIFDRDKQNNHILKDICFHYVFRKNAEWEIHVFEMEKEMRAYMECSRFTKLIMAGVELLQYKCDWEQWKENYIVLMGDSPEELMRCVSPGFRPSGLLLKPVGKDLVEQLLDEIEEAAQVDKEKTEMFSFKIKGQEYLVATDRILFFESRNKKIVLRTDRQEIEFYDTLDRLEKVFGDAFVRIHKSFLVNFSKISRIHFPYRTVHFEDGSFISFSRSYKNVLEKRWEERKNGG